MNKKIAVITDMDTVGSGYKNISIPLLTGLSVLGYDIKVSGLSYRGEEHKYPFSIIPAREVSECYGVVNNLHYVWNPDIILVAMDIPLQIQMFRQCQQYGHKYVAITPLENGPLTMSWSAQLFNMDAIFFISELGKQEAIKAGISKAEHLEVGVDSAFWRPPINDEKPLIRKGLGITDDEFVVLTVASNQERKNLWAGMDAVSKLKKSIDRKVRYILVTQEDTPFGWKLRDLAVSLDINQELMIFNRGMPPQDLWALYVAADVYLQPSKAEGLGMPVLEAMSCGVPCVATDTGALHEVLDGRGYLVPSEYEFIDVWGNSKRDMMDRAVAAERLKWIANADYEIAKFASQDMIEKALTYVRGRTWDAPVKQVDEKIKELLNAPQASPSV